MSTKFEEIYKLFLPTVDDDEYAEIEPDELEFVMKTFLLSGLVQVQSSTIDFPDFDEEKEVFTETLTHIQKVALAKSMKLEWVSEKIYSANLMRKSIGDRDYKAVQGTDYLKQLGFMEIRLRKEIDRLIIDHSYTDADQMGGLW